MNSATTRAGHSGLKCLAALLISLTFPCLAPAACSFKITSAGPCLANGGTGTPMVGQPYGVRVYFNVTGTPVNPIRIRFTIANVTNYFDNISVGPGSYW